MKRILLLILIMTTLCTLSGCFDEPLYDVHYPKPVIVEPNEETAYNVNGYKDTTVTYSEISESSSSLESSGNSTSGIYNGRFVGNKNSKKLHTTECSYAKKLKDENVVIFESIDEATLNGYVCCSRCLG